MSDPVGFSTSYRSKPWLQRNRSGRAASACAAGSSAGLTGDASAPAALAQNWRSDFIARLAETSNVRSAAEFAGISPTTVYDLRRHDPNFAQRWLDALCEGYDNLEMEMLYHLRTGEIVGGAAKFNFAVALRMLLAHRETVSREKARRDDVNVEKIRASIEHKLFLMRERVARRALEPGDTASDGAG